MLEFIQLVIEKVINDLLEKVGLIGKFKKVFPNLSQRNASKIVIFQSYFTFLLKIVFLDEPTSGLDPATTFTKFIR